jgi:DNA primase
MPEQMSRAVEYIVSRKVYNSNRYDFYLSADTDHNMDQRLIIPLLWQGECIGYTARALVDNVKPKYYTHHEPDFVFNMDMQTPDRQFVIVTEGPFDAMAVDGVAILGSEISDQQADIIDSLKREVIVVPDFDVKINERTGKKIWSGRSLIDAALEYNWSVSFPIWAGEYKDVAEAREKTDQLFVFKSILDARESSALKIELLAKKLYNTL